MKEFSLQVEPFNGTWVDCVNNNVISVLMTRDKSFEHAPCLSQARYRLHSPENSSGGNADTAIAKAYEEGLLLDVIRTLDLSAYLEFETQTIDHAENVHQTIKEYLHKGYYVFVDLDRFYYPTGVDAGKQHLTHPAFLYGYTDESSSFRLIEDCMQPSKMENYMLPYDRFDEAIASAHAETSTFRIVAARIKDQEGMQFHSSFSKELIRDNLQVLLVEEHNTAEEHSMYSKDYGVEAVYGLSAIKHFAETIEQRLLGISNTRFQQKAVAIKNPYFFRRATIHLPFLLHRNNWVNELQFENLTNEYKKLCNDWELYGNTLIKYYYKFHYIKDLKHTNKSEFDSLKGLLAKIYEKERYVTNMTIEVLA